MPASGEATAATHPDLLESVGHACAEVGARLRSAASDAVDSATEAAGGAASAAADGARNDFRAGSTDQAEAATGPAKALSTEQTAAAEKLKNNANFNSADAKVKEAILKKCESNPDLYSHYSKFVDSKTFTEPVDNGKAVSGEEKRDTQLRLVNVIGEMAERAEKTTNGKQKKLLSNTLDNIYQDKVKIELADNDHTPGGGGGANVSGKNPPTIILNREGLHIGTDGLDKSKMPGGDITFADQTMGTLAHEMSHATRSYSTPPKTAYEKYQEELNGYCAESMAIRGRMPTPEELENVDAALRQPPYNLERSQISEEDFQKISRLKRALEDPSGNPKLAIPDPTTINVNGKPAIPGTVTNEMDANKVKGDYDRARESARKAFSNASGEGEIVRAATDYPEFISEATPAQREKMVKTLIHGWTNDAEKQAALRILAHAPAAEQARLKEIIAADGNPFSWP
ncbi:MAG: hypothetical protein HYV63_16380 [Candidatus Schekmanbacteria bacterium]|nr:hypothetical protein [Candidatus Schekmanbacteria bacterium]